MEKQENVLSGIQCDVTNCIHNNGCCCCTAEEVHVRARPEDPESTTCETFSEI